MFDELVHLIQEIIPEVPDGDDHYSGWKTQFYFAKHVTISLMCAQVQCRQSNLDESFEYLCNKNLFSDAAKNYYVENKDKLFTFFDQMENELPRSFDEVAQTYENLLHFDIDIATGNLIDFKNQRQSTGSFYTPPALAQKIVQIVFDRYLSEKKETTKADNISKDAATRVFKGKKIIDLSCGCGDFLICAKRYLENNTYLSSKEIADMLYGIDLDPTAIIISIFRTSVDEHLAISNFQIGNPLLPNQHSDKHEKEKCFACGDYYSSITGIFDYNLINSFDIVIGNPPWEKIRFEERKFFTTTNKAISEISLKSQRYDSIEHIRTTDPPLYLHYLTISENYKKFKQTIRESGILNASVNGELNACSLFTELSILVSKEGHVGLIIKSSTITTPASAKFFEWIVSTHKLAQIYQFENNKRIFDIDSREKFSIILMSGTPRNSFDVYVGLNKLEDIDCVPPSVITNDILKLINPDTKLLPNIKNNAELDRLVEIHLNHDVFSNVFTNCHFGRLVHLTTHADHIQKTPGKDFLGIFEGKMMWIYDECYSTYDGILESKRYSNKAQARIIAANNDPVHEPVCRYYIEKEFWSRISKNYTDYVSLYWRSLTSSSNQRTMVATIANHRPTNQSIQLLQNTNHIELLLIVAIFNSSVFDSIIRLKLTGIDLTQKIIKQMPVPSLDAFDQKITFDGKTDRLKNHIISRVLFLISPTCSYKLSEEVGILPVENTSRAETISELDTLIEMAYRL